MIEKKVVEYISNLARIHINEKEKEFLSGQLSKILSYINKLQELNVDNIEPKRGAHFEENIFREDVVEESNSGEEILNNSPLKEGRFFKVPKVVE